MKLLTYRKAQNVLLLATSMVLGLSFYFEYAQGLQPCPLCLMQRLSAFLFGLICIASMAMYSRKRVRIIMMIQLFFAGAGLFFSTRQVWLQLFPSEQTTMCMPGVSTLLHYMPWTSALKVMMWGAADCGEVTWQFLGLSMPVWAAFYFATMLIASGALLFGLARDVSNNLPQHVGLS